MTGVYRAVKRFEEKRKRKEGFTLIELLVVVAIIAILAAIAIPQFTKYRKQAAMASLMSDARNCVTDAVAQITNATMAGGSIPSSGPYTNTSPNTSSCTWNDNNGVVSCTCQGRGLISGATCTASSNGSATCSGV